MNNIKDTSLLITSSEVSLPLDEVVRMIVKVDSSLDLLISRVEGHTGIEVNGESNLLFLYGDYEGNARKKELRC